MKPRLFTSIILFLSSYAPLFCILIVRDFNLEHWRFENFRLDIILGSVILASIVLLGISVYRLRKPSKEIVTVLSVRNKSNEFVSYTIPYLIAFFGASLKDPREVVSLSIFLIVIMIFVVRSHLVFVNPLLSILGYNLYEVDVHKAAKNRTILILSKIEFIAGDKIGITGASRFLYFATHLDKDVDHEQSSTAERN